MCAGVGLCCDCHLVLELFLVLGTEATIMQEASWLHWGTWGRGLHSAGLTFQDRVPRSQGHPADIVLRAHSCWATC